MGTSWVAYKNSSEQRNDVTNFVNGVKVAKHWSALACGGAKYLPSLIALSNTCGNTCRGLCILLVSWNVFPILIMQTKGFLLDKNRDVHLICINYSVFCTQGVSPISMGLPSLARACTEHIKQRSMCPYIACNIHKDLDTWTSFSWSMTLLCGPRTVHMDRGPVLLRRNVRCAIVVGSCLYL